MRPNGTDVRQLTTTSDSEEEPAVAPDGKILFTRGLPPAPPGLERAPLDPGVFILDPATGTEQRATTGGLDSAYEAEFSRDGRQIAFFNTDAYTYTVQADGSGLERRTARYERNPTWAAGSNLIFSGRASDLPPHEDHRYFLTSLDVKRDGAERRVLTPSITSADYPA